MAEKLLYSIREASSALSVGRSTVYRLLAEGTLIAVKVGRRTLIRVASIRRVAGEEAVDEGATT